MNLISRMKSIKSQIENNVLKSIDYVFVKMDKIMTKMDSMIYYKKFEKKMRRKKINGIQ